MPTLSRSPLAWLSATLLLLGAPAAPASMIDNGDFEIADLAGWTSTGGAISDGLGFALLDEDGNFFRSLSQSFVVDQPGETLSFDFTFSTRSISGTDTDSFAALLESDDQVTYLDFFVVDERFGPLAAFGADIGPPADIAGFPAFAGGTTISGHVSLLLPGDLVGKSVTLYFDLLDQGGEQSRAAVDNVALSVVVPAPGVLVLLLAGLTGMACRVRPAA